MKLLVISQKMNKDDTVMGFFHNWMIEFSKKFDAVEVICLEATTAPQGLPKNVSVFSLGKEKESGGTTFASRVRYTMRFYGEIIRKRHDYDAVFVHMNQEYILLGSWLWKLWGKRIYMWRNHHAGSTLTDIAAAFCTNVFCTSKFSYTAKYAKTILMPVGVDTSIFKPIAGVVRVPKSVLFLGRIAPIKKPSLLVEALGELKKKGVTFSASLYGDPLPKDAAYYEDTKKRAHDLGLDGEVKFFKGIPNAAAPAIYSAHEIFVNLSSSGMYDKTIFEAMACGSLVLASNNNLHGLIDERYIFEEGNLAELASKLGALLSLSAQEKTQAGQTLRSVAVDHHSLSALVQKLSTAMSRPAQIS